VVAVVHEPGGAHPFRCQGFFTREHTFYREYAEQARTSRGLRGWLSRWVTECRPRAYIT